MGGRDEKGLSKPASETPPEGGADGLVFEQLRAGLHRYLLRQLRRSEDVEDLAQEVYLRLLRFATVETIRFPKAYVFRVAFNVLYEFKHRQSRAQVSFDSVSADRAAESLADDAASPDEIYERQRREGQIEGLVGRLPAMQRAVLILATRESLSYEEIARKLDISASTARVHLYRATSYLRRELAKE
jgi:RNA polymerase sigma-70 factor (ECF subfamily)